jgi:hypothetical protein
MLRLSFSSLSSWSGSVDAAACMSPIWFADTASLSLCDLYDPSEPVLTQNPTAVLASVDFSTYAKASSPPSPVYAHPSSI